MDTVEPIDGVQKQQVICAVENHLRAAECYFGREFPSIPIYFDLRGRGAGNYSVTRNGKRKIRFNPYIFSKYFEQNLEDTVPHEVAHYICDQLYGLRNIKPHGKEWRRIMLCLGAKPLRTHKYDLTGIPIRKMRRFSYACGCTQHQLTSRRHNNIQRGKILYACKLCGEQLSLISAKSG